MLIYGNYEFEVNRLDIFFHLHISSYLFSVLGGYGIFAANQKTSTDFPFALLQASHEYRVC